MGQTLSEPVVEKHTSEDKDERIAYGASAMQGWRITMEDAHTTILKLDTKDGKHMSFFAVYDGHGGSSVAKFSGAQVYQRIVSEESFAKGDYKAAIKGGFLNTDSDLRANPEFANDPSGCTAVAALITDDWRIFVGNAGDSRAVLSAGGMAIPLSYDHKPVNPGEHSRITAAGGFVEFGRVNGNLALSRAIGDFEFKQNQKLPAEDQIVTANPDIVERKIEDADEFAVIACDGIWDCMSNQEVVDFVRQRVADGFPLGKICEMLMDKCLAPDSEIGGVGCDNMTVVIVAFLKGHASLDDWYEAVKDKVWGASDGTTGAQQKQEQAPVGVGLKGTAEDGAAAATTETKANETSNSSGASEDADGDRAATSKSAL